MPTQSRPISKKTGIAADFKPKSGARKIRYADKKEATKAGDWAVKAYPSVFKRLAE